MLSRYKGATFYTYWGRRVRYLVALIAIIICCAQSNLALSASSINCQAFLLPPVDIIVCKDPEVAALDAEMTEFYSKATASLNGPKRSTLVHDQEGWQSARADKCGIPNVGELYMETALHARVCLIHLYADRIKKLAENNGIAPNRLLGRQAQLTINNIFFTVVAKRATYTEGGAELERISKEFPFESFALYPPYGDSKDWQIVFASYVNETTAESARDLARALGVLGYPASVANSKSYFRCTGMGGSDARVKFGTNYERR